MTQPTSSPKRQRIPARLIFTDVWCWLGFGFGSGLSPVAPGTLGTLAALPLYAWLSTLSLTGYFAIVLLLFALGILICQKSEERLGISDHSGIVWDEIVGYLVTMTAVPFTWPAAALGFALFRLFDILKPWPIRHFDRTVHGGFGIMLDDVLAGVLAAACLQLARPWLA